MKEILQQPWPWYVSGPLIGLMVPLLLYLGNKPFGISSSLRHFCAACFPTNAKFFDYDWKAESWNMIFVAGIILGGFIAGYIFPNPSPVNLSESALSTFSSMGITNFNCLYPEQIFSKENFFSLQGFVFMALGGFLVGFGTRYANGCTSGHSIMGLSNLQLSSLIATISFFVGGLVMTWIILPFLF